MVTQCGLAYNWTGQGGAEHEGGVDGEGALDFKILISIDPEAVNLILRILLN